MAGRKRGGVGEKYKWYKRQEGKFVSLNERLILAFYSDSTDHEPHEDELSVRSL